MKHNEMTWSDDQTFSILQKFSTQLGYDDWDNFKYSHSIDYNEECELVIYLSKCIQSEINRGFSANGE